MNAPVRTDPNDPARRPRSLGRRLQLLLVLLIIPGAAVTIPTLLVTNFFGRQPKLKAKPIPAPVDTSGLAASLDRSANALLPTPAPLTPEPIRVKVRPDRVAARAGKVMQQARSLGGSAVEGLSEPGDQRLYVDLPGGSAAAFRQAVTDNAAPVPPVATPLPGAARDQLEIIIHGDEDE